MERLEKFQDLLSFPRQFLSPGFSGLLGSLKYLFRFEVKVVWKKNLNFKNFPFFPRISNSNKLWRYPFSFYRRRFSQFFF